MSRWIWGLFLVVNCMKWVLPKFIESLLALNYLFKDSNSFFTLLSKYKRIELVSSRQVSSANKIVLNFPLIDFDKSFM